MNEDDISTLARSWNAQTQRTYAPNLDQPAVVSVTEFVSARHFATGDQDHACSGKQVFQEWIPVLYRRIA